MKLTNILSSISVSSVWLSTVTLAYDGTTTFDSILLAHPAPTFCPTLTGRYQSWAVDAGYLACCENWLNPHTLTTGLGPGSKALYSCCRSGYTCTAPVSLMKDWVVDSNGDLQTRDIANPPTPTTRYVPPCVVNLIHSFALRTAVDFESSFYLDPGAGITNTPAGPSTGTFSGPGATPITTSAGVIVYVSNENSNNAGGNTFNVGNTSGSSPSPGAIAGITVACTVVSTIAAVLGVWYARKKKKAKAAKSST